MAAPKYRRIVLKLSGEALAPEGGTGIDGHALTRIAAQIEEVARLGVQIVVVVGGGNIFRGKELAAAAPVHEATAHYMGMLATVLNALALQDTIEARGLETRVQSAISVERVCENFIRRRCLRHLEKGRIVILAAGTGNPFVTTDTCAAQRAIELGADVLLKGTKVDGVYSDDPVRVHDARFFPRISYNEVIARRLQVMDVSAIDLCQQHGIAIVVFDLNKPGNMKRIVLGEPVGTLISSEPGD